MKSIARITLVAVGMAAAGAVPSQQKTTMNPLAERYVKAVLALGQHDADYVDAYYGPQEWKKDVDSTKVDLDTIASRAAAIRADLKGTPIPGDELGRLRWQYLDRQLSAMQARIRMLKGERLSFDDESKALYDAVAPTYPVSHFQVILDKLEKRFPGAGSLAVRYDAWRKPFAIPREKLDAVFQAAIGACRERTVKHVTLPPSERFTVEYVTNKSWSGYNWYQGDYRSLIQVNTDLPIYIDRAIDLACHEGYPGHHVYNALLEKHLVRDRGWPEFAVYPLFSPQSLIAEGTANFGIEVAFPGRDRVDFEKTTLFPAAGLDASKAQEYYEVQALVDQLAYAGNEAARQYIDGKIPAADAAAFLEKYALYAPDRAKQRVRFIEQYRSYVINYNLGKDMVRKYIESRGGTAANPARRWSEFEKLLSSPRLPSELK
ncbi:MAG TPA: hypothetical protein VH740_07170 [Vicinamibacterales bacterium]|jgi:hypothetical protein